MRDYATLHSETNSSKRTVLFFVLYFTVTVGFSTMIKTHTIE
jgi:hypothetical protein